MRGDRAILGALALALAAGCDGETEARYPCDGEPAWGTRLPLYLRWFNDYPPLDSHNFVQGVRLVEEGGEEIPLEAAGGGREVVLCPLGGLTPGASYRWDVDFENRSGNQLAVPTLGWEGEWRFTADPDGTTPFEPGDCAAWWDENDDYFAEFDPFDCECAPECPRDSGGQR